MFRKDLIYALSWLSIGLSISACSSQSPPSPSTNQGISAATIAELAKIEDDTVLSQGQEVYLSQCAACHGAEGEGQFPDNPLEPDTTGRLGAPPHDETGHTWHHDDDLLIRIIKDGGMGTAERFYTMPEFGSQLSDAEMYAVLAYIKTMWTDEQRLIQAERTLLTRQQE